MATHVASKLVSLFFISLCAACGGGGGGSGSSVALTTTTRPLIGLEASVTETSGGAPIAVSNVTSTSGTGTISTRNGNHAIYSASMASTGTSIGWSVADGDNFIEQTSNNVRRSIFTDVGVNKTGYVNSTVYQNWGAWAKNLNTTNPTGGVFSAGSRTSSSSMKVTGSATYTGLATGFYARAGDPATFVTFAELSATANFGTGLVSFSTSSSAVAPTRDLQFQIDTNTRVDESSLNASGTLSISGNNISGVITDGGGRSGSVSGYFYGPLSAELGGVANLTGNGTHIFSFGGRR